ncbi:MAG: hypothetical protein ACYTFY_15080 [Planctomycetota bacterium]|jgi:hypothetical protein
MSTQMTIKTLKQHVEDGVVFYLHAKLELGSSSHAALLNVNTELSPALLMRISTMCGDDTVVQVGAEPAETEKKKPAKSKRLGICASISEYVREEAAKYVSDVFVNKATICFAAREVEKLLEFNPVSKLETALVERAELLRKARDRKILGSMLSRGVAECISILYLKELAAQRDGSRRDVDNSALIFSAIMRNYAQAKAPEYSEKLAPDQMARLSIHLLRGGSLDTFSYNSVSSMNDLRNDNPELAKAYRTIIDHTNPMTKSQSVQILLRGKVFCDWLLSRQQSQGALQKEMMQKSSFFNSLEISHFFDLSVLVSNEKARAILAKLKNNKDELRLAVFVRFLSSKGKELPIKDPGELRQLFEEIFKQFPDYNPLTIEPFRHFIVYANDLYLAGVKGKEHKEMLQQYEKRMRNLLF